MKRWRNRLTQRLFHLYLWTCLQDGFTLTCTQHLFACRLQKSQAGRRFPVQWSWPAPLPLQDKENRHTAFSTKPRNSRTLCAHTVQSSGSPAWQSSGDHFPARRFLGLFSAAVWVTDSIKNLPLLESDHRDCKLIFYHFIWKDSSLHLLSKLSYSCRVKNNCTFTI